MTSTERLLTAMFCVGMSVAGATAADLKVWTVDPLIKVFRDSTPAESGPASAEVARGEHATLQVVVWSDAGLTGLRAVVGPFTLEGKAEVTLQAKKVRPVGYVPVDRPMHQPPKDQLRQPPAEFPDPLLEDKTIDVGAKQAQPIWITVPIPTDAAPGLYHAEVKVSARASGKELAATTPAQIRVYGATVTRTRLWVTNWFNVQSRHMAISPQPDSPQYWELLRRYARNMAEHRQNVALISPLRLTEFRVGSEGELEFDFARFDRWVGVFKSEGMIGRIEGGRAGDWQSPFVVWIRRVQDGKAVAERVAPASPEADRFYARFLPALVEHLREKGWLGIYMQHLADEPTTSNLESYRALAGLVRRYAPQVRIIEACHAKDLVGCIDVWVPQLNYLKRDYEHYRRRQQAGEEVWLYTCIYPQGEYANRFIEQPLLKTRLLHWINHRYGITGYLHWGYNQWTAQSPFEHTTRPHGKTYLPAGDPWIVYPGKAGPLDSIRWEAMRDGIVDHELLSLLAERDAAAARRLVEKHVLNFDRYEADVEAFRATRRELLELLSRVE